MDSVTSKLELQLNFDGRSAFLPKNIQFWPNLALVIKLFYSLVATAGFYCGASEPPDVSAFLKQIIVEGVNVDNVSVAVRLASLVYDISTLVFIRLVKLPTGYYGCGICTQPGLCCDKRFNYPNVKSKLGNVCSFRIKISETSYWCLSDHKITHRHSCNIPYGLYAVGFCE